MHRAASPAAPRTDEQTLEPRDEREMWTDPDPLSESGVRHLRVEVLEDSSGRWRKIRLGAAPSIMVHA